MWGIPHIPPLHQSLGSDFSDTIKTFKNRFLAKIEDDSI